jgi:DNA-binding winged helix-turn-helix (wHTH) protein/Tol biopolymer transport system component
MKANAKMLRFDRYEIDLESFDLRRMGRRLPLSRTPMELLLLLIENRGKLVTRDEIAARLWKQPEAVDVVQGINTAVNRIRGVLNDDPAKPRFIETVIGRGYRFIAEVEEDAPASAVPLAPAQPPVQDTVSLKTPRKHIGWLLAGSLAACLVAALLYAFVIFRESGAERSQKPVFSRLTGNEGDDHVSAGAISPDGRLMAYAAGSGISLRVVQGGAEHLLASPPSFAADRISWFADDLRLAVSGFDTAKLKPQIWMVYVTGNSPRLLVDGAHNGAPSPDGRSFAYTTNRDEAVWLGDAAGEAAHILVPGEKGLAFPYIFWSADSKRVLFERQRYAPSSSKVASPKEDLEANYRWSFESADARSGRILNSVPDMRFDSACLLPDGRLLYLRWDHKDHRQSYALWEVQTNPSDGTLRSAPRNLTSFDVGRAFSLSTSSAGREIALVLEKAFPTVYVAGLRRHSPDLIDPVRLTRDLHIDFPHAWTPGGDAVVFESNRGGTFGIYRQRVGSRNADLIASLSSDAVLPQTTPGGQWLMFAGETTPANSLFSHRSFALYRVPLTGGRVEEVPIGGPLDEFRCPVGQIGSCVLRETVGHQQFVYYALDPVKGKGPELGRTAWSPTILGDWDVSTGAASVALPIHDLANRTIRIVPLGPARGERQEQRIVVNTLIGLGGITYAPDSQGFYAGVAANAGSDLIYIDLKGRTTVLRETVNGTWGVPSPDGSRLAFVDYTIDSNVWMSSTGKPRMN